MSIPLENGFTCPKVDFNLVMEDQDNEELVSLITTSWRECSKKCRDNENCCHWKWHNPMTNKIYAQKCILSGVEYLIQINKTS
jgi:hypothetical protein